MGVIIIVLLNSFFATFYVLTKVLNYDRYIFNLIELMLCGLNGVFLLLMACMMLSAVNTIRRITYKNSKDPNTKSITLHLIMVFTAFAGMTTMWIIFTIAKLHDFKKSKYNAIELRTIGILVGNIGSFIAMLVLLYMFWGFGIGINN